VDQQSGTGHLGLLNTIDEPTRACLAIVADCSINAYKVVATLDELAAKKEAPKYLRTGNGPELAAYALADWSRPAGTGSTFTGPGCPWLGAWVESFNGRPQDELPDCHQSSSLLEARALLEGWRDSYNNYERPHRALGMLAPAELAAAWYDKFNQPALA
jgi:putative transposase